MGFTQGQPRLSMLPAQHDVNRQPPFLHASTIVWSHKQIQSHRASLSSTETPETMSHNELSPCCFSPVFVTKTESPATTDLQTACLHWSVPPTSSVIGVSCVTYFPRDTENVTSKSCESHRRRFSASFPVSAGRFVPRKFLLLPPGLEGKSRSAG